MHVHLESVYFPKMSSVYKHIAITSTSVKWLAPGAKLNIPWTPAWEMNSYLNPWHGLVDMKALIERVALKEGAKAEWHQARVDVAGGYDVTWVCASPTRQCSSSSRGLAISASQRRHSWRLHTQTHKEGGRRCEKTGCTFHTLTWLWAMSLFEQKFGFFFWFGLFLGNGNRDISCPTGSTRPISDFSSVQFNFIYITTRTTWRRFYILRL